MSTYLMGFARNKLNFKKRKSALFCKHFIFCDYLFSFYDLRKIYAIVYDYNDAIKLVNYDYKVICSEHEIYEDGLVYLNKCSINGIKNK